MSEGTAYGLGVGPGDPELVTLKALRLMQRCEVLAYPAPETGPSLARGIVAPHLEGCTPVEYAIRMPMEAARFPAAAVYDRAASELGAHLAAGRDVAVLCQGDPFFYGSFMYLFTRLATRFTVEVVPGVAALTASAPILEMAQAASVIPATLPEADLTARLAATDAAAIIKIGRHMPKLRRVLDALGLTSSARYIERATLPEQAIRPLAELADDAAPYFATVLVHRRGGAVEG